MLGTHCSVSSNPGIPRWEPAIRWNVQQEYQTRTQNTQENDMYSLKVFR